MKIRRDCDVQKGLSCGVYEPEMYQISNTDFALLLRLLRAFVETKPTTRREQENRRRAVLLRRKMERKSKQ